MLVKCPDCGSEDVTRCTPYDYICQICRYEFKITPYLDIKPCPGCGNTDLARKNTGKYMGRIACICGWEGPETDVSVDGWITAIECWNHRDDSDIKNEGKGGQ